MKKKIPSSRLQQNKYKLCQGTQQSPQKQPERRNSASNHWEFHGDVSRHGQSKHTKGTSEIPRRKNKEYESTHRQISELKGTLNKHQSETENTINIKIN
jgi:hypothetical protein